MNYKTVAPKLLIIDALYDERIALEKSKAELEHFVLRNQEVGFFPVQVLEDVKNAITCLSEQINFIKSRSEWLEKNIA